MERQADVEMDEQFLWEVANIEVKAERESWLVLSESENATWRKFGVRANNDRRYCGILECAFENYDYDKANPL